MHYELEAAWLDTSVKFMNFIAPRHHAKSSVAACIFPLYHLMYDEGNKVIVLSSKTNGHAINLLQTIKDVLDYSQPFREIFGYWGKHSARVWTKDTIIMKDGSVITTRGTGMQVHGIKFGNQRPTLFIVDDPEDENNTKTAEAMEWNLKWLLQAAVPALDAKRGRMIVIGTPEHERCIVETLFEMRGWLSKRWTALTGDPASVPKDKLKALWPELMSVEDLVLKFEDLKRIGRASIFYRQYMCWVTGDEEQMFPSETWRFYRGKVAVYNRDYSLMTVTHFGKTKDKIKKLADPLKFPVYIFTGIDPASSISQRAAYSTIVSIAVRGDNTRLILPYFRQRVRPMRLARAILKHDSLYKPRKTRVETVGYQEMVRDYLRENRYIPGLEVKENPRKEKSARLEGMQPKFYENKVWIADDMIEMMNELSMYPYGKTADLLDGLYYAMKIAYAPDSDMPYEISGERRSILKYFDPSGWLKA